MTGPADPNRLLSITELAHELAVTPRAVRFYETKGLIKPPRVGSTRVYSYRDRARMLIILRGKRLGFSLAEIKEYLDLYDADPKHLSQLERLLGGVRKRIDLLEDQRRDLELTLGELRDIEEQTLEAMSRVSEEAAAPTP